MKPTIPHYGVSRRILLSALAALPVPPGLVAAHHFCAGAVTGATANAGAVADSPATLME